MNYVASNLDFEYAWAPGAVPKQVIQVSQRFESILKLIAPDAEALDAQVVASDSFPDVEPGGHLVAWGWTPHIVEAATNAGLLIDAPPLDAVRQVNSKRFSHDVASRHDLALPGAQIAETNDQLDLWIAAIDGPWLIKHPWGVSGRRQRQGTTAELPPHIRRWANAVFETGEPLIVEPRLDIDQEFSVHFDVLNDGGIEHCGICRLLSDRRGTFRGIEVGGSAQISSDLIDGATKATRAVAESGYFGPVGIDAMIGHVKQQRLIRPITEINARYTFGRLAIALHRRLGAAGPMTWHHPPRSASAPQELKDWPSDWNSGTFLLPDAIDPGGRSGTYVQLW